MLPNTRHEDIRISLFHNCYTNYSSKNHQWILFKSSGRNIKGEWVISIISKISLHKSSESIVLMKLLGVWLYRYVAELTYFLLQKNKFLHLAQNISKTDFLSFLAICRGGLCLETTYATLLKIQKMFPIIIINNLLPCLFIWF